MRRTFAVTKVLCTWIGLAALVAGCKSKRTVVWNDLTKTNQAIVTCNLSSVNTLSIRVYGRIEGTGKLITPNWRTNLLSGVIKTNYGMDHFSTNCTIIYEPVSSRTGHLQLRVTFSRF